LASRRRRASRAADIGVLQETAFDGLIEESLVKPTLQDGFDRGEGAGAVRQSASARCIEAIGIEAPGQGQNEKTGSKALFRMGRSALIPSQRAATEGPSFTAWASTRAGVQSA